MWHIYIIENKLGHLYTGITKNVEKRFEEHCAGGPKAAKALKGKGPLSLRFHAPLANHSQALKAELWIKKQSRTNKLRLINKQLCLPEEYTVESDASSEHAQDAAKSHGI